MKRQVAVVLIATALAGCANLVQVKVDVVDQRTALENQALGAYRTLEGETMTLASVRSVGADGTVRGAPPLSREKKEALAAMRRSRFNKDDLDRLKEIGAVGEANNGYVVLFPDVVADEKERAFAQLMVTQENEDRKVLYGRIAATGEGFTTDDLDKVAAIMAGVNADEAPPGALVQGKGGQWKKKPSP